MVRINSAVKCAGPTKLSTRLASSVSASSLPADHTQNSPSSSVVAQAWKPIKISSYLLVLSPFE